MEDNEVFDEDWFYASIKMYKTLQMYELLFTPQKIIQTAINTLAITGNRPNGMYELLQIRLPKKLTLPLTQQSRCKDNDFTINAGCHLTTPVLCLSSYKDSSILVSRQNMQGIEMYQTWEDSDTLKVVKTLKFDLTAPYFATWEDDIVVTKYISDPIYFLNGNEISISNEKGLTDLLVPKFLDKNVIYFFNCSSGSVFQFDRRTAKINRNFFQNSFEHSTDFNFDIKGNDIALVCNKGNIVTIDQRSPMNPVIFDKINMETTNKNFKINIIDNLGFSLSGFDSTVGIYSCAEGKIKNDFVHEGHTKLGHNNIKNCLVTDHILSSDLPRDLIISCCDNKTLNCWDYPSK